MNLPTSKSNDGYIGIRDFRGEIIREHQKAGFIYHSEVCIWKDPVVAMQRTKTLGLLHKQLKKDSTMSRQGIADYLVVMRKDGENEKSHARGVKNIMLVMNRHAILKPMTVLMVVCFGLQQMTRLRLIFGSVTHRLCGWILTKRAHCNT